MMRSRSLALVLSTTLALGMSPGQDAGALFAAAQDGNLDGVRTALDAGIAVDTRNEYEQTALFFAADRGHRDIVELLLERGANPNLSDSFYGATPLVWALNNGHVEVALLLVQQGADGAVQVLLQAIRSGNESLAAAIIAVGPLPAESQQFALAQAEGQEQPGIAELVRNAPVSPEPTPPPFEFDPATLPRYVGMYRDAGNELIVEVTAGETGLRAEVGERSLELEPTATNLFASDDGDSMAFGGRGGAVEFARIRLDSENYNLQPVDPDEAELIRRGSNRAARTDYAEAATAMQPGWPGFRGHAGTGNGDHKNVPTEWDADDGAGVAWKAPVAGLANSSPIAWGDRVFVTSAVSSAGDDTIKTGLYGDVAPVDDLSAHRFVITALDRNDGGLLWERTVYEGVPAVMRHTKSSQANSTPVTDGRYVVVLFGSVGLLAAFDYAGVEVWRTDVGILDAGWFYDPDYQWGHAASPIIYDDLVIVQADVQEGSHLAAYSLADGTLQWRTERDEIPSWSTPVVYRGRPADELITNGKTIRAYDPRTGAELWTLGPNSEVVVGMPVLGNGVVYVTAGYPPIRPIYAVRPGGRGNISLPTDAETSENIVWSKNRGGTYIPTPVLYRGILYTLNNNGLLSAYDARGGDLLYRARLGGTGGSYVASPLAADGYLYCASEDGVVQVVRAGPEYELVASNDLGEVIWATPAITQDLLIVRTLQHVWAFRNN